MADLPNRRRRPGGRAGGAAASQQRIAEATLAVPLLAGYAFHRGAWRAREAKRHAKLFAAEAAEKR